MIIKMSIMISFCILLLSLSISSAWMPTKSRNTVKMSSSDVSSSKRSKSVPFLVQPAKLDGTLAGDEGFDPLGLSSIQDVGIDLYWMREAELKHARVGMIASLGFIAQEKGLFMLTTDTHNQISCFYEYAKKYPSSIAFFLIIIGLAEIFSGVAITEGRKRGDRLPGDYGFNPLSFGKSEKTLKDLSLKEIRNGRLAMIAAAGMILQSTTNPTVGVLDFL